MVRHDNLCPVRNKNFGGGYAALLQRFDFLHEIFDAQRHAVADDIGDMAVEHAGRKLMQGKFTVIVYDGMARVAAALKADDDI